MKRDISGFDSDEKPFIPIRDEFMPDGVTLRFDEAMRNIRQEMADDYANGRVKSFVEGEHIGCINNQKRGPAPMLKNEGELYAERQKLLRETRAKNDEAMTTILKRRR